VSVINRNPNGLLGYLGIKNFGRNAQTLAEVLAPVWDTSQLYLNNDAVYLNSTAGGLGAGITLVFDPPADEVWWVHDYSVVFETAAGGAFIGQICRVGQVNTAFVNLSTTLSLGASTASCLVINRPLVLGPGEKLGIQTQGVVGVVNTTHAVRYTALKV